MEKLLCEIATLDVKYEFDLHILLSCRELSSSRRAKIYYKLWVAARKSYYITTPKSEVWNM